MRGVHWGRGALRCVALRRTKQPMMSADTKKTRESPTPAAEHATYGSTQPPEKTESTVSIAG